ncbi:MAG TPA: hypothetical protein DF712_19000 [Balneola sp.]|jgi:uncharacterized membrane protein|nr:hypothetical protein [Bacteroidota bacterium]MAC06164.1 hypothetical protein [Balneola sp.]MAO78520.1 hypothetical protein [Balneola sp.]MBF64885.1 hypothetical protein [Balneola sp.]HAH50712.1 hypothetical protein [Balneola sp.]|tara:strand:+ start:3288 stop:3539 length:252 start_codon:yes stop_codon:yes gene_type:complete
MAKKNSKNIDKQPMFFSSFNYKIIGIAIFLIITGFTAMYMENEIDGFISLFISPIMVMSGYVIVIFAILKHNRGEQEESSQPS